MSTTLVLSQPLNRKYQIVEVAIGDLVKVTEWDNIVVKGIVTELTDSLIVVSNAEFIEGCYPECDYSEYENQNVFVFNLDQVAQIDVAKFERDNLTFEKMVSEVTRTNYCGSEKIIMSPMFWNAYSKEVRNSEKMYCQYPIIVDESLDGLYVYAVPNKESAKHFETPKRSYRVEYYMKREEKLQQVATSIVSSFDDELEDNIKNGATRVKARVKKIEGVDVNKLTYRVLLNQGVVARGKA